jgi:hypothetical protein
MRELEEPEGNSLVEALPVVEVMKSLTGLLRNF